MELPLPRDKWHLIFITLVIHGVGTMIAWNMFITAKDYFVKYKLENVPMYSRNFLAYVGWASHIPNLFFSWLNVFITIRGRLTTRILWSLFAEVVIFFITVILAMIDSSKWATLFFWLTMILVFFLNASNAIFQNCVYGVAAKLPARYTGAVVLGCNICGTFVVLLSWVSQNFENIRTSAIYYFIGGMFVLLICFDTFVALPLNKFYCYYDVMQSHGRRVAVIDSATNTVAGPENIKIPFGMIFKLASVQLYNIFLVFFVSLAVFPAVISDIHPTNKGFLGDNFVLITCFLTFNFMAMVGNITASLKQFPGPRLLVVFSTVRLVFIPFFLLCNYQVPGRTLPVLITCDWWYWFMAALLGWSHGHVSSLGMMYVGGTVAAQHTVTAGMIGAGMLVTGILSGITFTRLCPIIVSLNIWSTK